MTKDEARSQLTQMLGTSPGGSGTPAIAGVFPSPADVAGLAGLSQGLSEVAQQLSLNTGLARAANAALDANTSATVQNTQAKAASIAGEVLSRVSSGIGGLLGGSPLIAGIRALFAGGTPEPPPALIAYQPPEAARPNLAVRNGGATLGPAYLGAGDRPREIGGPASITVNINAIDSRSFLDHSESIAMAVRAAMLNSGALSDVLEGM